MSTERETLGSRMGFLLLTAGCAIGLGNIWRFPYITGKYGGALFQHANGRRKIDNANFHYKNPP